MVTFLPVLLFHIWISTSNSYQNVRRLDDACNLAAGTYDKNESLIQAINNYHYQVRTCPSCRDVTFTPVDGHTNTKVVCSGLDTSDVSVACEAVQGSLCPVTLNLSTSTSQYYIVNCTMACVPKECKGSDIKDALVSTLGSSEIFGSVCSSNSVCHLNMNVCGDVGAIVLLGGDQLEHNTNVEDINEFIIPSNNNSAMKKQVHFQLYLFLFFFFFASLMVINP